MELYEVEYLIPLEYAESEFIKAESRKEAAIKKIKNDDLTVVEAQEIQEIRVHPNNCERNSIYYSVPRLRNGAGEI